MSEIYSVITGTGSFIPPRVITNDYFLNDKFYEKNGELYDLKNTKDKGKYAKSTAQIVAKLAEITGIEERRYVDDDFDTSDIGFIAAQQALHSSGNTTSYENLDFIFVAHNFGDVKEGRTHSDIVPSKGSKIKHKLGILNPYTEASDNLSGCPGTNQLIIMGNAYIKAGFAQQGLVVGTEILHRVADPHDMDKMIYSDGAGALVLRAFESDTPVGILSHVSRSDTFKDAFRLYMDKSNNPDYKGNDLFLKMYGPAVYKYAVRNVPLVVRLSLEKANLHLTDVSRIFIHQANARLDDDIIKRLFSLYRRDDPSIPKEIPDDLVPMSISWLGNSSVATVPTLLDLVLRGEDERLSKYGVKPGDVIVLASVGAGMNINSIVYKIPSIEQLREIHNNQSINTIQDIYRAA